MTYTKTKTRPQCPCWLWRDLYLGWTFLKREQMISPLMCCLPRIRLTPWISVHILHISENILTEPWETDSVTYEKRFQISFESYYHCIQKKKKKKNEKRGKSKIFGAFSFVFDCEKKNRHTLTFLGLFYNLYTISNTSTDLFLNKTKHIAMSLIKSINVFFYLVSNN